MPRIPEITRREQLPESQRHHFDSIVASRGLVTAPYRYLLHVPEFAARMAGMTRSCSDTDGTYPFPRAGTLACSICCVVIQTRSRGTKRLDHNTRAG